MLLHFKLSASLVDNHTIIIAEETEILQVYTVQVLSNRSGVFSVLLFSYLFC